MQNHLHTFILTRCSSSQKHILLCKHLVIMKPEFNRQFAFISNIFYKYQFRVIKSPITHNARLLKGCPLSGCKIEVVANGIKKTGYDKVVLVLILEYILRLLVHYTWLTNTSKALILCKQRRQSDRQQFIFMSTYTSNTELGFQWERHTEATEQNVYAN